MKLKLKIIFILILIGVISSCFSKVEATQITSIFNGKTISRDTIQKIATDTETGTNILEVLGITTSGYKTNNSKVYWKIVDKNNQLIDLYCLNLSRGFGAPDGIVTESGETIVDSNGNQITYANYDLQQNLNTISDEDYQKYTGLTSANKDQITWILNNSLTSTEDIKTILKAASSKVDIDSIDLTNIDIEEFIKEDMASNSREETKLTFEDIKIVQQIAIWHYTNSNSVLVNNFNALCDANGREISSQGINIDIDGHGTIIRSGKVKQAKLNAIYDYFIDGAENGEEITPILALSNTESDVVKQNSNYIVGPFSLNGTNTDWIKDITANVNIEYKLLDESKNQIIDKDFSKVIGKKFYLEIDKKLISEDTQITINLDYKYDVKKVSLLSNNNPEDTQPVIFVEIKEEIKNTSTSEEIELIVSKQLDIELEKVDELGNLITSSKAKFEISGAQNITKETEQGLINLDAQTLNNRTFELLYKIKEITAPTGYNKIEDELSVKIVGTIKVENGEFLIDSINFLDKNGNSLDNSKIVARYDEQLNKVIITIVNTKIENGYSVRLLKVGEDGQTAIEGAWFKIDNSQPTLIAKDGTEISTGILSQEGEIELEYSLEETLAPDGYIKIEGAKNAKIKATIELIDNEYQITDVQLIEEVEGVSVVEEDNVITIKVENKIQVTGKYNVVIRKVDNNGNILEGSKFKIDNIEYDLSTGEAIIKENEEINSLKDISLTYIIQETVVPEGYIGIQDDIISIEAKVQKDQNTYKLIRANLVDGEGNNITNEYVSVGLEGNTIVITVKNTPIEKKFDLALRKFITAVNDIQYSREPVVDTSKLGTVVDGNTITTATYKHSKEPIAVQKGDIVTYTIRVYNEGELDGYVDRISDYLPDNLLPIIVGSELIDQEKYAEEIEFNLEWGWILSEDGNYVTTTKTSKANSEIYSEDISDTKLEGYKEGSDTLDYIDVQIKCLVSDNAVRGEYLTNIAEIVGSQDINAVEGDGEDSSIMNVDYSNLSDYKNDEAIGSTKDSYIEGQEDDDDFEKLVVKEFDLALRKFITVVNDKKYSREPVVDTSKLGIVVNGKVITTATYNHSKEPVIVETNDIVTYTIRIYNEGTLDGFANEIVDNIPEGLEFIPKSEINISYNWVMLDSKGIETTDITKAVMIKTDYLSDDNEANIIRVYTEEDGVKTLNYKDIKVQFKVIAKPKNLSDNIIINEAQISADNDRDIDSNPTRTEKYDYSTGNNEDDIDYEPIKLQYFDLALRKFITKVNSVDYNNRYPEIIYNENGGIKYSHTKEPVFVTTGDTVIYTIRVYNEGEKAGYATEIKDNLPEGLAFDPNNETNKTYKWKMLDSEGKVTEEAEKVVAFSTDYLKNEKIDPFIKTNGTTSLTYKDVQIAFIVTESELSNRILVNTAQISADSDEDIDSEPNNNIETEDDLDKEYVRVQYFDLSLKKWVTETRVTLDGKTTTTKTNFTEDSESIAKVDIVASKLKKTTVKFVYNIKVTNEGELPGYAYEVKDYIPNGLKFVAEDNKDWKEEKDGIVVTDKLKDTLLNPGESATVQIVLTWKNSSTNLGLKTNYAEISKDSANDIDSIPDNYDFTEDDIDDAQVILSIKTAGPTTYIGLVLITVAILAGGIFLIKKYVLD